MITRIVKMKFRPDKTEEFQHLFKQYHSQIAGFKNCRSVKLLRDIHQENIFFTYSEWESETDLNNYRNSELFKLVWGKTKVLFEEKAEAWSINLIA